MREKIIHMLKTGKLPNDLIKELCKKPVYAKSQSDYWVIKAICGSLGLSDNDFYYIVNKTFNEFGLK